MKPIVEQYQEFHRGQREAKYRLNFIKQMQDELQSRVGRFPSTDDITVIIRVEVTEDNA